MLTGSSRLIRGWAERTPSQQDEIPNALRTIGRVLGHSHYTGQALHTHFSGALLTRLRFFGRLITLGAFGVGILLLGNPTIQPTTEFVQRGRRDKEYLHVRRKLDLMAFIDHQQPHPIFSQGLVNSIGYVFVASTNAVCEPLLQFRAYSITGEGQHETPL